MFAKGNRFPTSKPPAGPGPNEYDIKDPEFDAYKRGAFLEKQDRFSKENPSDGPGPGTYATGPMSNDARSGGARVPSGSADRYSILQKKLEDLQRVHDESKKAHQSEVERLKLELSRAQRIQAEQVDHIGKLKKQNSVFDERLQELKKINLSDQSEIKDLRAKLRVSEHERSQLAGKQGDASASKKALHAVEYELQETRAEAERARSALATLRAQAAEAEDGLVEQLNLHKEMLSRVAEEYGRLASATVSKAAHERVKREANALQLRVNRLERKFTNAEGQIVELAQLIRRTKGENDFLSSRLAEAEGDLDFYSGTLSSILAERDLNQPPPAAIDDLRREIETDFYESEVQRYHSAATHATLWSQYEGLRAEQLLFHASCLIKHVDEARRDAEMQSKKSASAEKQQSELLRQLSEARAEHEKIKAELAEVSRSVKTAQAAESTLKTQLDAEKQQAKAQAAALQQAVRREKEARDRATADLQKSMAAQEGLLSEISQLSADLTEAERYQDAYNNLIDQVDALVRKKALAEDEANKLSKFNAEILGHHNPAQRIQYVDRIRQELYEAKQELLMTAKERDALASENDEMVRELQLYKSVTVPTDFKPRTTVTRVTRQPLASQSLNTRPSSSHPKRSATRPAAGSKVSEPEYREGDLTLDELTQ